MRGFPVQVLPRQEKPVQDYPRLDFPVQVFRFWFRRSELLQDGVLDGAELAVGFAPLYRRPASHEGKNMGGFICAAHRRKIRGFPTRFHTVLRAPGRA